VLDVSLDAVLDPGDVRAYFENSVDATNYAFFESPR